MNPFVTAALLLTAFALATPFSLIAKRALPPTSFASSKRDGCPAYLTPGEFEFPHYITQISAVNPDISYGPSYSGVFTPNDISSIFAFDIPASRADANCTLEFLFPKGQLRTSNFEYSGGGTFFFTGSKIGSCPGPMTSFNHQPEPGVFPPFPPTHMEPGFAYTIDVGPCSYSAGSCISGVTSTNDTYFSFFQDYDECPIGVYTAYSYGLPCEPPYC
ncbi:ubiquitin 3 binding protein But2 C-terminal domain-containing protein [Xylariales sp. AK1849]|nr:ubiquitin 3 binding protein But2 C-terminal domain-containing protein [Xylariales sp. AK1849]